MAKIVSWSSIILLSITLTGCAAFDYTKSMFVSGVSLEAVGEQFLSVTHQVGAGCQKGEIPRRMCEDYGEFHERFKRTYPLAVGMWMAADRAGDAATKQKAEDVVRSLSRDLAKLAAEALSALVPEMK